jgi:hypothetical protein
MKALLTTLFIGLFTIGIANDFKVKIQVELVDHAAPTGTKVKVLERQKELLVQSLDPDGEIKLELESGRLFEIWIVKDGYMPQVIHNVHAEGDGKYKITLYKNAEKLPFNEKTYSGTARIFDDVKSMQIPAEYLAQGVNVVNEDEIPSSQKVNLKAFSKVAKSQEKAQSKIDKCIKKRTKLEEKINEVDAAQVSGEISQIEADEKKLKLQKEIVKINKKLEKLYY